MNKKNIVLLLVGIVSCLVACKKNALKGIDKNALFAKPTVAELQTVQSEWNSRNLVPTAVAITESHKINDKLDLKIVSYKLYGYKQYAIVLLPNTPGQLPVQLYVSGFGLDLPISSVAVKLAEDGNIPLVYVVPSLRGQSVEMTVNGITYKSPVAEGQRNDAFDGAADDALAALNAVESSFPEADTHRLIVRGGSRGATVVLLMGIRDKRIKRVVSIAGPTDLLSATSTHENDPTYKFQFLDGLINGSESISRTRIKLIASSPLYFCEQLPQTQVHLGEKDKIVLPLQGQLLSEAMRTAGKQDNLQLFIYPNRGHEDIANGNTEMEQRISTFLEPLYH